MTTCDQCGRELTLFNPTEHREGEAAKYTHNTPGDLDAFEHRPVIGDDDE